MSDTWVTFTASIDTTSGDIDYSGFARDPEEWFLDAVRINLILNGYDVREGDELLYYVDNLIVHN